MGLLFPLLMAAATQYSRPSGGPFGNTGWPMAHGFTSLMRNNMDQMDVLRKKHKEQMEVWKKDHEEQMMQWAKDGPFGNNGSGEEVDRWDNMVAELKEKPLEEHHQWQELAWSLLEEWLKDDSPSSSLNLEGWKNDGPLIHLSSRVTMGNSTEERVGMVPASTLLPLIKHLATSPLFARTVPMLLPVLVPAALLFFLGPLLVVPIVLLVVGGTIVAGLSFFGSILISFFSTIGLNSLNHWLNWAIDSHDIQGTLERLSEEKISIESDTVDSILTSTSAPPLVEEETASTNGIVHSEEVPRFLAW